MKKKRIFYIFDIIILCIVIILSVISFKKNAEIDISSFDIRNFNFKELLVVFFNFFYYFFLVIIGILIEYWFILAIYFAIRISYFKYVNEKVDETDFADSHYFRHIIDDYSPAVISYINSYDIKEKDCLNYYKDNYYGTSDYNTVSKEKIDEILSKFNNNNNNNNN